MDVGDWDDSARARLVRVRDVSVRARLVRVVAGAAGSCR